MKYPDFDLLAFALAFVLLVVYLCAFAAGAPAIVQAVAVCAPALVACVWAFVTIVHAWRVRRDS